MLKVKKEQNPRENIPNVNVIYVLEYYNSWDDINSWGLIHVPTTEREKILPYII